MAALCQSNAHDGFFLQCNQVPTFTSISASNSRIWPHHFGLAGKEASLEKYFIHFWFSADVLLHRPYIPRSPD